MILECLPDRITVIVLNIKLAPSNLVITVHQAIFLMMGAEMGSSFMNALVSLGQSGNRDQFRRAFAATTMNDVYNFLCYFALLPLELLTGKILFNQL